jgi:hypothetical protein
VADSVTPRDSDKGSPQRPAALGLAALVCSTCPSHCWAIARPAMARRDDWMIRPADDILQNITGELASRLRYAGHRSLMDSSLDVSIAKKQIGPDVEAAIGDTS